MIDATLALVEERGIGRVTVRAVAKAADVNIAAVSYHFGSKQALVAAALEGSIRHMVADSHAILDRMSEAPREALEELFAYYLEGALQYPRVTKAHLHAPLVSDDYDGPFPVLMKPVIARLRDGLRAAAGLDARRAAHRTVAALSAVFFPVFFGGLFRGLGALETPASRARYAREVARAALLPVDDERKGKR